MDIYNYMMILHIVAVISWFAGLFYLPRLFVYHVQSQKDSQLDKTFQIMEKKLLRYIMNPAMIVTFISGFYLASIIGFEQGWLHAKITLVLILAGFQGFLGKCRKNFISDKNKHSERFYRYINEIPTIILIIIVSLVILKPF